MQINGRPIGWGQKPYCIAEISCNHRGDTHTALQLIDKAIWAGADAVKFQLYSPDSMTLDLNGADFVIQDGPWAGRRLYDLYKSAQTTPEIARVIMDYCKKQKITAFASVFDTASVDFLEKLDCPAYKIASFEITDTPLIQYVAMTGKPLIISTGMATMREINDAAVATEENDQFIFLHCVSGYPTPVQESDLGRFATLNNEWGPCGISDHSLGWEIPIAATAMGAVVIEKHLTLSRDLPTEDADFSLEPAEFKAMVEAVHRIWQACQVPKARPDAPQRQLRRSLYAVQNIPEGALLTKDMVKAIRPGYGLAPNLLDEILGQKALHAIQRGDRIRLDQFG